MYHLPRQVFSDYAHLRVEAMLLRDEKGNSITISDWQKIDSILLQAWRAFAADVASKK